jgi:hypothetical protein
VQAGALVVIWTLASDLSTPGTNAMTGAASEALGPDTALRVEAAPDPEGMRLSDAGDASAVVRLSWDEAEHRRARILCFFRRSQRWIDREVVFDASDPERERGRTLGFLLASMVINASSEPEAAAKQGPPNEPERAGRESATQNSSGRPAATRVPASVLAASAEVTSAGAASGYGFWIGVERAVVGRELWIGGGAHARFGYIAPAQASSRLLGLGLHMSWLPVQAGRLTVGSRIGGSLAQLSATTSLETQNRVLPSAEVLALAGYRLSPGSVLSAQAGGEFLSGVTRISVAEKQVATWPWAAVLLRVGIETAF